MKETIIFNEGNVTVTDVRFVTLHQTFAMSGVTSVRKLREKPNTWGMLILCIFGVVCAGVGTTLAMHLFGAVVVIAALAVAASQKPNFFIVITTASGESRALTSKSNEFIDRVEGAVNEAVVVRG
jgi:hypothetical protein